MSGDNLTKHMVAGKDMKGIIADSCAVETQLELCSKLSVGVRGHVLIVSPVEAGFDCLHASLAIRHSDAGWP